MGEADKRARELIDQVEEAGRPGGGHLDRLRAVAEDADVKRVRRRRAVELIAVIDGDAAVAVAGHLAVQPWMNADAQEQVVQRLLARDAVRTVLPMLGSGELDERVYADALRWLAGLAPADLLEVLGPYVARPGRCDPASLLGLMRVLVVSGQEGAAAVAALARDDGVDAIVRTEAGYALERERPDVAAGEGDGEPDEHTLVFHASRFRAESFEHQMRSWAEASGVPYQATIGEGRFWREVRITVTARAAAVTDLARHARSIGRFRGDWGGPGHGAPWHASGGDGGDWGGGGG